MKITMLYAFHFTSGPVDSSLARIMKNVKQKAKEVDRQQRCHSRS